jgi:hypothetical protein
MVYGQSLTSGFDSNGSHLVEEAILRLSFIHQCDINPLHENVGMKL